MAKTIFITGSTDGIGLETAKRLAGEGHDVLLHGRSAEKLRKAQDAVGGADGFLADLSRAQEVRRLAAEIAGARERLDVLINNAGVFGAGPVTDAGLDLRFAVNTIAPALLTAELRAVLGQDARVVSLSSAAQAPVDPAAIGAARAMEDFEAYAQSKLAMTIWSQEVAAREGDAAPVMISVNPGSLLATKMVRDAFSTPGNDIQIGVDILVRASLAAEFAQASGRYFDNDAGQFAQPHPWAGDAGNRAAVFEAIGEVVAKV